LSGIKVPAVGIEMSLKQDEDWSTYVDPIARSCKPLFDVLVHAKCIWRVYEKIFSYCDNYA
jgi:hypothetical protein